MTPLEEIIIALESRGYSEHSDYTVEFGVVNLTVDRKEYFLYKYGKSFFCRLYDGDRLRRYTAFTAETTLDYIKHSDGGLVSPSVRMEEVYKRGAATIQAAEDEHVFAIMDAILAKTPNWGR